MPSRDPNHRLAHMATRRARVVIADTWQSQANLSLFLVLLVVTGFLLPSLGFARGDLRQYSNVVFSLLLISGVAIAWGRRKLFAFASVVAVVTLVIRSLSLWKPTGRLELWSDWWSLISVLIIVFILLVQVFREGPVTHLRIQGAIAVYLLFGVAWSHAYHIAAILQPGSFNVPAQELSSVGDWAYFSYVTLTTVGYGDITPVKPVARNLALGEALAGQLYLAVMIARLVAMEVINWQVNAGQHSDQ